MNQPTKKQLNERIAELENDLVDAIRVGDNDQLNKLKMKHFNLIAKVLLLFFKMMKCFITDYWFAFH